ncbi:MAG: serine/threonine protein kinase [Deltaproteobacteria bacterium]|nr:serine/threonine protein kinase [Deltaproteobacteria bacterium]
MNPAPAQTASQTLPRTFGRYQLFDRVGAGGMAEIYLARARTELGGARLVVVKQILPDLSGNEQFAEMLIQEAKLAARLNHANVVQVFDLGRHEGVLFIAMDYVDGFDLNELLRRCARSKTPLPIPFALLIVIEALRGLDYAHRRADDFGAPMGIVHRDVSPSNVLISFDGEIKLCDFGIARANDMADVLPEDAIKGKAGYMSPEQARGEPIDARSDVFAIGIVLWELIAGRKLYKASDTGPTLLQLARAAEIPPLPSRDLPSEPELHAIVEHALTADRDQRFASAQAMLKALEGYVADAKLMASPIRFGEWLRDNFGQALIVSRKARERAARAIELGPAAVVEPYGTPAPPAVAPAPAASTAPAPEPEAEPEQVPASKPHDAPVPDAPLAGALGPPLATPELVAAPGPAKRGSFAIWFAVGVLLGIVAIALLLWK